MVERLRYTHRVVTAPRAGWVPWVFPPPRAHVIELAFDAPVPAFEVARVAQDLRPRQTAPAWAFDGARWRPADQPASRDARVHRLAVFRTVAPELVSAARRADQERDAAADEAWAREHGEALPEVLPSLEAHAEAWRRALPTDRVHTLGSPEALQAEIERVRSFFAFEWDGDGFRFEVVLTAAPGADPPGREPLREALRALGYQDGGGRGGGERPAWQGELRFEPPLGADGAHPVEAWVADGGCTVSVVLSGDTGPAARDLVDVVSRTAEQLERAFGLVARCDLTGDADRAALAERAAASLALLEGDGYFLDGRRVPDVDDGALEALVHERHDLASPEVLRAAGRTLTARLTATDPRFVLGCAGALASALVAVAWPWAALAVAPFAALAAWTRRARAQDVALDLAALTVTTGGRVERHPLPVAARDDGRLRDRDGRDVDLLRGSGPAWDRLRDALFVRGALAERPIHVANRVALETIFWATASPPGWWRGHPEGYVAAAIGDAGGLAFFADQEGLDAWVAGAPTHRLMFVRAVDHSGKGATIGYPSPVEWCAPLRLPPRAGHAR